MPIKLNGKTIIDETNLANKDLSNISSAGANVIKSYVQQEVSNMMTSPNFSAAIILTVDQQHNGYTPSVDGYLFLQHAIYQGSNTSDIGPICTIAGKTIYQVTGKNSSEAVTFWTPVSSGQQIKTNTYSTGIGSPVQLSHFTQVMFVPKK